MDTAAFDAAAALPEITGLSCDGPVADPEPLIDVVSKLSKVRGMRLFN